MSYDTFVCENVKAGQVIICVCVSNCYGGGCRVSGGEQMFVSQLTNVGRLIKNRDLGLDWVFMDSLPLTLKLSLTMLFGLIHNAATQIIHLCAEDK